MDICKFCKSKHHAVNWSFPTGYNGPIGAVRTLQLIIVFCIIKKNIKWLNAQSLLFYCFTIEANKCASNFN